VMAIYFILFMTDIKFSRNLKCILICKYYIWLTNIYL